ncbi:MAG TPA: hypothetical protein VG013_32010 [Gemmataceae bacterium]|jgi:hypothetical protein|nr:hypothetical protein [Gemmataceae bacterium]
MLSPEHPRRPVLPAERYSQVLTWDLASGRPREVVTIPDWAREPQMNVVRWCGPRGLLVGGMHVIDLDVAGIVCWYAAGDASSPDTPDGRFWHGNLKAWTVPHKALADRLERARGGFVFHRGLTVRAEVQAGGESLRARLAEKLADALAGDEFNVDPAAAKVVRLKVAPPKVVIVNLGTTVGSSVKAIGGAAPYASVEAHLQVLDRSGRVAWTSPALGSAALIVNPDTQETARVDDATAIEAGLPAAAATATDQFVADFLKEWWHSSVPALIGRDADNHEIRLPCSLRGYGTDGVPGTVDEQQWDVLNAVRFYRDQVTPPRKR